MQLSAWRGVESKSTITLCRSVGDRGLQKHVNTEAAGMADIFWDGKFTFSINSSKEISFVTRAHGGYLSPGRLPPYGEGLRCQKNGSARSHISFLGFKGCLSGYRIAFTGAAQLSPSGRSRYLDFSFAESAVFSASIIAYTGCVKSSNSGTVNCFANCYRSYYGVAQEISCGFLLS